MNTIATLRRWFSHGSRGVLSAIGISMFLAISALGASLAGGVITGITPHSGPALNEFMLLMVLALRGGVYLRNALWDRHVLDNARPWVVVLTTLLAMSPVIATAVVPGSIMPRGAGAAWLIAAGAVLAIASLISERPTRRKATSTPPILVAALTALGAGTAVAAVTGIDIRCLVSAFLTDAALAWLLFLMPQAVAAVRERFGW